MSFYDNIQDLLHHELYDEIVFLDELVPERFRGHSTAKNEALTFAYIGEAYYQLDKYLFAAKNFKLAVEGYGRCARAITTKGYTENDVRFRYHRALVKLRKFDDAITVLRCVPENDAPPKVRAALIKLLSARDGNTDSIPSSFHEAIVKTCPSALVATSHLLKNGSTDLETVPEALRAVPHVETFIDSQKMIGQKQHRNAINSLLEFPEPSYKILIEAGYQMYLLGMDDAKHILYKAHRLDPEKTTHMDVLAYLFYEEEVYHPELEPLAVRLMKDAPESAEAQICFAYLTRSFGKSFKTKALQMAFGACQVNQYANRASTHALLLKANILVELEQADDAVKTIQEALKQDPNNFDLQKAIVNSFLCKTNHREARNWLNNVVRSRPDEPRVNTLKAIVQLKLGSGAAKNEAQKLLEQSIEEDPHQMDAIWMLLEVYEKNGRYDKGRDLLRKLTQGPYNAPNMARIHQMLSDFLSKCDEPGNAYESVSMAMVTGSQEASGQISSLEVAMYTTPSPMAPVARGGLPQAPRRNRNRQAMDSSADHTNSNA